MRSFGDLRTLDVLDVENITTEQFQDLTRNHVTLVIQIIEVLQEKEY